MSNIYGFTALTGGGTGALDKIPSSELSNGDLAIGIRNGVQYSYTFDSSCTDAEDSPGRIKPDAGSGCWKLAYTGMEYVPDPSCADQNGTSGNSIKNLLIAIGTTNRATIKLENSKIAGTTYTVASNADWSAYTNVTFKIVPGALLQTATGTTTTFGGPLDAGPYQVFDCVGTGKVVLASGSVSSVLSAWFGNGSDAINQALKNAGDNIGKLEITPGTYVISSPISYVFSVGSSRKSLTIVGAGAGRTILDNQVANGSAISISTATPATDNGYYIEISGIEIKTTTSPALSNGIEIADSYHVDINKNYIHNLSGSGIVIKAGTALDTVLVKTLRIESNDLWNNDRFGIDVTGGTSLAYNLLIENNDIEANKLGGIYANVDSMRLQSNIIAYNGTDANSYGGMYISGTITPTDYPTRQIIIERNGFEANYPNNLSVNHAKGISIGYNQFIRLFLDGLNKPLYHISFGQYLVKIIQGVEVKGNFFRAYEDASVPMVGIYGTEDLADINIIGNHWQLGATDTKISLNTATEIKKSDAGDRTDYNAYRTLSFGPEGTVVGDTFLRRMGIGALMADGGIYNQTQTGVISGGAVAVNCALGLNIYVSVTENITISAPTNIFIGQVLNIYFCQSKSGGGATVTFNEVYKKAGGAYTLTITEGKYDLVSFLCVGTIWFEISRSQNM